MRPLARWLDDRTGIETAVRNFLYEDIPASSGWRQAFGSVALFLFLVQVFTGAMLAFNYAPTPGDAYNSLRYILTELTAGSLMRGLHHWGASMMIAVVVLHMVQVFLYGAYKRPREATWMVGVVLLLLTLAYGLTGYLLPWDNRAYWGTVVATRMAAAVPYAARLLGGHSGVGVVTFARFYGLHVLLLPAATVLLIALHIFLVRRHGVAPMPGDELCIPKKFYPGQALRDTVAIFIAFVVLFVLALVARVPLDRLADPTDSSYIPRPEWYFLFLFQSLKFFQGPLEVFGSVFLPVLAVLALLLVPFVDRGAMVKIARRTTAFAVVGLAFLGWAGLTAAAVFTTPKAEVARVDYSRPTEWIEISPEELAGIGYFRRESCGACHGTGIGPDLAAASHHKSAAWMIQHFKRPSAMIPGTPMPAIQLTDAQLNTLAAFLLRLNSRNAGALQSAPDFAVHGAMIYQANHCGSCHEVNGAGMKVGPPLNGLSKRRTQDWTVRHFRDPRLLSPGTIMPPYRLSAAELRDLTAWLFALPEP